MGTHFIGEKKLKKFSNKYNVNFIRGYNSHEKGTNFYVLNDEYENIFVLTITKDKKYIINFVNGVRKNISYCDPTIQVRIAGDTPYLSEVFII